MEQTNQDLSGKAAASKAQPLENQTSSNNSESIDDRFLRQLLQIVKQFPAKSFTFVIAAISLIATASGNVAILLHRVPNPAEPELEGARSAVRAAFPVHGLETPKETNVSVLINTLSNNLGSKIAVPETLDPTTDISGHWRYKCTAFDRQYSHGGEATIDTQMTPYGPQWRLNGVRQWREIDGKREENVNFQWSTDWAAFTEKDRIKYTYHIVTDRGAISGFADGAITERQNGMPVRIEGTFFQLPPLDPMYGKYEFVRE